MLIGYPPHRALEPDVDDRQEQDWAEREQERE
jgi:hypothetical protein